MIWLIGNKGMLGRDMETALQQAGFTCRGSDLEVDITSMNALTDFLRQAGEQPPRWIINCSAYTAVDKAEEECEKAFRINGEGVANIARVARDGGATLVHISTDYVFNGSKKGAYLESDPVNPASVYGASKLEGERYIKEICPRHYILRTAWLYGNNGPNFVFTILRLFKSHPELKVVADQRGTPTYTKDLAGAIVSLIKKEDGQGEKHFGIYHYTNDGETTWCDFARDISRRGAELGLIEKEIPVRAITTAEYPTPAKRPANSLLSKAKICAAFGITLRSWQEALEDFLKNEVKDE